MSAKSGKQIVRNRRGRPVIKGPTHGPSGLPLLRTSERGTFQRCRWRWWMEFYEQTKPKVDVPPLRFGTLIHSALAAYYKPGVRRGPKPAETFEKLYEIDLRESGDYFDSVELSDRWAEAADLGVVMLERYLDHYGKDDEWKVIVTEYPFQVPVSHPVRGTPWFWYVGILDGVWESRLNGKLVIPEHKTTVAIQPKYLSMDRQATAYWTFGVDALLANGIIAPNGSQPLAGILFNFLRKAKRDERPTDEQGQYRNKPKREHYISALGNQYNKHKLPDLIKVAEEKGIVVQGEESKRQPVPYHARVPIYRDWYEREGAKIAVLAEYEDMERVIRDAERVKNVMPPPTAYKNGGQFTCPSCWAYDICELHEIGQDWVEMKKMTTQQWKPYAAHEIAEGR